MKQKLKGLLIGLTLGAVISSTTAFAANETIPKDITYRNINIVIDGNEITPTDANGNYVEPFIMDGTTYLPVRAISNALGKEVSWDGDTATVYIGEQPSENIDIVGNYTLITAETNGQPIELTNDIIQLLTLRADGTGDYGPEMAQVPVFWTKDGNNITLTSPFVSKPFVLTMEGNQLKGETDSIVMTFIKTGYIITQPAEPKETTSGPNANVQKELAYRDIKIVVDGNEITPTDANGNYVEPFIMDGTTYLPVRAVANAFGKEVGWDDTNSTVYLGTQLAESNNVVGTYVMVNPDPASTERFTLILKENYKASISDGYDTAHITWYQRGNTITLVPPSGNGDSITLIIDGDRLISGEEGDEGAFIKAVSLPNPMAQVTMKTVTVDKTDANKPIVTIEMENGGIIKAELYPDVAPITVENFISLIEKGFYDGLTFHRNIPGFVIQGGCPVGNGTGGPGYTIKGEFSSNGVKNDLKHTRGVLSMARAMDPDSAGSQFFIMHADAPHLDGEYAAFGKVIEGMNVVDTIANSGM